MDISLAGEAHRPAIGWARGREGIVEVVPLGATRSPALELNGLPAVAPSAERPGGAGGEGDLFRDLFID